MQEKSPWFVLSYYWVTLLHLISDPFVQVLFRNSLRERGVFRDCSHVC